MSDTDMDIERCMYFIDYYNPVKIIRIEDKKIFLGDKSEAICRFCGKAKPDTTFRKEAHAIPEFIGNKRLVSFYECDICNERFGKHLENHFANYLGIWRTLAQIKGKEGVPSFKSGLNRIDVTNKMRIENHEDSSILSENAADKTITVKVNRPKYIPMAIYKTLVKMGLSILPDSEVGYFSNTFKWVCEEGHINRGQQLYVGSAFTPGPSPHRVITNYLFRRRSGVTANVPYMIYVVTFSNFMFQVFLPLSTQDKHLDKKKLTISRFPVGNTIFGPNIYTWIDCSSNKEMFKDPIAITLSYDEKVQVKNQSVKE